MQSNPPTPQPRPKTSGLAVTAFVLSCIFFLPLVPLVGAILGIVSLATFRPDRGGRGLAIAAIPTGIVVAFMLQGMLAAIAIPSFIKYTRKSKAAEARVTLGKLAYAARDYAQAKGALPVATTGWTPPTACCEQPGRKCAPSPQAWAAEPWRSMGFDLSDPHRYQYRYESSDGRSATLEARGDLDCDGRFSSLRTQLTIEGGTVNQTGPTANDELD